MISGVWTEIVNELVTIFKATQNHAERLRCLVRNRFMLTSRLARFVKMVEYTFVCFFQKQCKTSTCLTASVMESFAVGWWGLRWTEKALKNRPRCFTGIQWCLWWRNKLNGTCLVVCYRDAFVHLNTYAHWLREMLHTLVDDLSLEFHFFPVSSTMTTYPPDIWVLACVTTMYIKYFSKNELIVDRDHESREIVQLFHNSRACFRSRSTGN